MNGNWLLVMASRERNQAILAALVLNLCVTWASCTFSILSYFKCCLQIYGLTLVSIYVFSSELVSNRIELLRVSYYWNKVRPFWRIIFIIFILYLSYLFWSVRVIFCAVFSTRAYFEYQEKCRDSIVLSDSGRIKNRQKEIEPAYENHAVSIIHIFEEQKKIEMSSKKFRDSGLTVKENQNNRIEINRLELSVSMINLYTFCTLY